VNDTTPTTSVEPAATRSSASLVERMDTSIGEATTVMGAVMTELLRRTLRGGVMQIGDQLHTFVAEKVDATIADRTPAIERNAAEVAEHTARTAATEVAVEEVKGLEKRTQASDHELAVQIEHTARSAQETTTQAARDLAMQIEETGKRVGEAARAELTERIEDLIERAREGTTSLKARLKDMEGAIAGLGARLVEEQVQRHSTVELMRRDHAQALTDSHSLLERELKHLRQVKEALSARVAELEKPRGLRGLLLRIRRRFSRRVPEPIAPPATVNQSDESEQSTEIEE
jgi:hypothetical protein